MPAMTSDDIARRRADLAPAIRGEVTIERDGVVLATEVPMAIWPASESGSLIGAGRVVVPAPPGLAGARAPHVGITLTTTDAQEGDVVKDGPRTFTVLGVADWVTTRVLALSEVGRG